MQFDAALAAQDTLQESEAELGADWDRAVELEGTFSSNAGALAREAYERIARAGRRHPQAHAFQAFCIYITWQQVTEETIAHHFHTGMRLSEAYLASPEEKTHGTSPTCLIARVVSCRIGLGRRRRHRGGVSGKTRPRVAIDGW